jgi:hypothetical protein
MAKILAAYGTRLDIKMKGVTKSLRKWMGSG